MFNFFNKSTSNISKKPVNVDKVLQDITNINYQRESVSAYLKDHPAYADNTDVAKKVLSQSPYLLKCFSDNIRNNYQIVEQVVQKKGEYLLMASRELKANKNLIILAIKNDPCFYRQLSSKLKMNRDIVEVTLNERPSLYTDVPSDFFKMHRDITEKLLRISGDYLQDFSKKIKDDKYFVGIAVGQRGYGLKYASKRLKDDVDIVRTACELSGYALIEASQRIKNNRDFIKLALKTSSHYFQNLSDSQKNDREFVEIALSNNGMTLEYVSKKFKSDVSIVLMAIKNDSSATHFMDDSLKTNKNILATLFNKSIWDSSLFIKGNVELDCFNSLESILKEMPQEFFIESFKNSIKKNNKKKLNEYKNNPKVFDLFFELSTIETLEIVKRMNNNKISWLGELIEEKIKRKRILNVEMPSKVAKKDRKISFGV